MSKRWRNVGLYVLLAIVVVALGTAFFDRRPQVEVWRYSQFIDAVQAGQVAKVSITSDRTQQKWCARRGAGDGESAQ